MSLTDKLTREPRSDVYELAGVELFIPTDEQLAKARGKSRERGYENDLPASVSIAVRWKPKTYQKFIGDDEVTEEVDYYRLTTSKGLSDDQLSLVREAGFNAIPQDVMYKLPSNKKAVIEKQPRDVQRLLIAADRAGIVIDIDEQGNLFTPQVGKLYECLEGPHDMPTWDNESRRWDFDDPKQAFFRLPVKEATDFVQPEELAIRKYARRDDSAGDSGGAATTTSQATALTAEDIAQAFVAAGITGKPVSVVNAQGSAIVSANVGNNPAVFGNKEIVQAAQSGKLVEYLVEVGAAKDDDGTVVING